MHVRPLSQMLLKEVDFFCHRQSLSFIIPITSSSAVAIKQAGIESLTEGSFLIISHRPHYIDIRECMLDFVNNLEASFPSTVSTILRTAGKLGMRTADAREQEIKTSSCPLCGL